MVVVGIPGVGKTTIVQGVISGYPGAKLVGFGSLMLESALSKRWVKSRDEMRKLPVEKQKRLQKLAAAKIANMKAKAVIVDTHLFIRTEEGFWPGLPFEVVRAMDPTHLVLVEAAPEDIAKRRSADASRQRDSLSLEGLGEELSLGRSFMAVASSLTGAPMMIVKNEQGKQDQASRSLVRVLEQAGK